MIVGRRPQRTPIPAALDEEGRPMLVGERGEMPQAQPRPVDNGGTPITNNLGSSSAKRYRRAVQLGQSRYDGSAARAFLQSLAGGDRPDHRRGCSTHRGLVGASCFEINPEREGPAGAWRSGSNRKRRDHGDDDDNDERPEPVPAKDATDLLGPTDLRSVRCWNFVVNWSC